MVVGTGAGQIANTESNAIAAGTTIEASFQYQDTATTQAERLTALDLLATQYINELVARYQAELRYFGLIRT